MRWAAFAPLILVLAGFSALFVPFTTGAAVLDPTFGTGGKVTLDVQSGSERAVAVAIQADGKIVTVGGNEFDWVVLRFDEHGVLDPTFDGDGKVVTDFGEADFATSVIIQADGKIVVGGGTGCLRSALARYNPDGSLDTSFDGDGKVMADLDPAGCEHISDLGLGPNGSIITFGTIGTLTIDWAVARFDSNGALDASFGTGGRTTTDFGDYQDANAMAIQADGKIIAVGYGSGQVLMARYTSQGLPDPTFDTDGKLTFDWEGAGRGTDVTLDSHDRIVVVGNGTPGNWCAVARLNPNGTFDSSFDEDGKATALLEGSNTITSVAVQLDDKVIVGGSLNHDFDNSFLLVRFDSKGELDPTFGSDGVVTSDFGKPEDVGVLCPPARPDCSNDILEDLVILNDGRIVAVGGAGPCTPTCLTALARYQVDTTPPTLTVAATPSVLWPPNQKMITVHVALTVSDNLDPNPDVELISATSDGGTAGPDDIEILSDTELLLRAERDQSRDRVYRICYRATDDAGNITESCAVVTVRNDRPVRVEKVARPGIAGMIMDGNLSATVPNPVRHDAVIDYYLPRDGEVRLSVYDIAGRDQARLVDGFMSAGRHQVRWKIPPGGRQVYWYRLDALGETVRGSFVVRR